VDFVMKDGVVYRSPSGHQIRKGSGAGADLVTRAP
jgi:hypothetical protein